MAELRRRLGTGAAPSGSADDSAPEAAPKRKRRMSAAARRRIALAQRKRWAEFHKAKDQAAAPAKRAPKPASKKPTAKAKAKVHRETRVET